MSGRCGNILIRNTVTKVCVSDTDQIGAGDSGYCGTVIIEPGANVIYD